MEENVINNQNEKLVITRDSDTSDEEIIIQKNFHTTINLQNEGEENEKKMIESDLQQESNSNNHMKNGNLSNIDNPQVNINNLPVLHVENDPAEDNESISDDDDSVQNVPRYSKRNRKPKPIFTYDKLGKPRIVQNNQPE